MTINIFPPAESPFLFNYLPIYVGLFTSAGYDFFTTNDAVSIPSDGGAGYLQQILNTEGFLGGFNYAISNNTAIPLTFDLLTDVITTNGTGNYFLVLSNLDNSIGKPNSAGTGPGPFYRYESGTSMSTPMVSGMLALLEQYYLNAFGTRPSPAMLKAMVIDGAHATGFYDFNVQNSVNYEGWGLINLPNSLPPGLTNQLNVACSDFIQDQSPANALATGDSRTFYVTTTNAQPLRVTLVWTDPPGNPAAAIKLVNNLTLVVTNLSNSTNPVVYYGNDIPASSTFNSARSTTATPVVDSINNVQNVYLPLGAGTSFSVTVSGYRVNVNAVTAQANNVVQDYALVISCGNGQVTNVMTVAAAPPTPSNYTGDQNITYLSAANNNGPLLNQIVGANTPLLGTNTIVFAPGSLEGFGPNNWQVTAGMTNQWHFYVVTNSFGAGFTNAAFITFLPPTLSDPRMGVFADSQANATRPEADIDLYVSTDPTLTNLNPVAISNAVVGTPIPGTQVGETLGGVFSYASLGRGGTEFVVDTNSQQSEVYYIGVKSEDQMASEYNFISIFSQIPFSQMKNGNQVVTGVPVPVSIPDGSPAHPGSGYMFGLAIYPMTVGLVTVSDEIWHQNFGDLIGTLTLNGGHPDVLNNHDSFGNPPGPYLNNYDDSGNASTSGSRPTDGPGSLTGYIGEQGIGLWLLSEVDDSLTQTGYVQNFSLTIQPHQDLKGGVNFTIPPGTWFYGFIDVPPGATNLTVTATNFPPLVNPPLELFVKLGALPTTNNFDGSALINTPGPAGLWGSVSLGPPLVSGRYWIGIFNPSLMTANGVVFATIGLPFVPAQTIYTSTDTPIPILDDAVTTDSINVPDFQTISSMDVAIAVQHPRISDLVFHLISPDGTRDLLMENRGGTDPNGAGGVSFTTNAPLVSNFDTAAAGDYSSGTVAGWTVAGNQVSVETDPTNAYPGNSNLLTLANGTLYANLTTVPGATYTLKFAYRGPGAVGWWRGESNAVAVDSIYGNNGTLVNTYYTNGEVGQAFAFDPELYNPVRVAIQDLTAYQLTNSFSMEGWIRPRGTSAHFFWRGDNRNGLDPYELSMQDANSLGIYISSQTSGASAVTPFNSYNQWTHVAGTLDGNSGKLDIYTNGVFAAQTITAVRPFGALVKTDSPGVGIGNVNDGANNFPFWGDLDEMTLYSRALSASEIKTIYADGTNGKYDATEFLTSAAQSLAEAQISVNGSVLTNLFGNNAAWQTYTVSFKATQTSTPLQIQGVEPGMLLGAASVVSVQTNYNYLVFTENTNLTTTPIKFAVPPFVAGTTNIAGYVQWPVSVGGNGHWYKAVVNSTTNPLDWTEADQIAHNEGGYLATITSSNENNFVFSLISSSQFFEGIAGNGSGPAIGGTNPVDGSILGDWVWETGEPWTYSDWAPGQPDFPAETRLQYWSGMQGVPAATWNNLQPQDTNLGGYVIERDSLPTDLYYLPEQSLDDAFDGENALGTWTLEIQDDRVGATNPAPQLLSWQLRFNYVTTGTNANGIPSGTTATNVIPAGGWSYFPVNVPTNADFATNILVFATGPLNMWFNPTNNPIGANPPDYLLLGGVSNGLFVLSLTSSPTNIVPGTTYFIGLQNTNAFAVTNGFQVDFHLILPPTALTNGVPVTNSVPAGSFTYYSVTVPTNANAATNLLLFASLPVNVWFNQTNTPVGTNPPDYLLITNSTSGVSTLTSGTVPPLVPGSTYYLGVQNTNAAPVTFGLEVNFQLIPPSGIVSGPVITFTNNGILLTWFALTNYQYQIQWTTTLSPPPIPWITIPGVVLTNLAVPAPVNHIGEFQYFDDGSLTGGFGVQKFYRLIAYPPGAAIPPALVISTVKASPGGLQIQWNGSTNYIYDVLWTTNLVLPMSSWNVLTNLPMPVPLAYGGGVFTFTDNGTLTGGTNAAKFFRVQLWP
ncbi:MAG TPA: LamG-like jellyroll fold domain-containing protein [Verrucomicrobiae bacterium]|nr:LamG-like jellyroll fold domain-containing protein [Verrucomicrobiae bacterium]